MEDIALWAMGTSLGGSTSMADGYVVSLDEYDNKIYCYGKGQMQRQLRTQ